jgi:radical SAM-linked protein
MNSQNITKSNPAIFRFKFLKKAEYKYLSHLDIINIMIRAVARSGIKIKYDQGFNPKPKISFSNPTPLGVESLAEYCDITIIGEINENDFLNPVNAQLPEQLKIVDLKKVSEKIPSLMSDISVVLYSFKLKSVSNKPGREADVFDNEAENLKGGRLKLKDAVEKGYANFRSIYKLEFESYTDNNIDTNTSDDTGIIKGISDSADTPGNIIFLKIFGYAKIFKEINNEIFKFNNFMEFFQDLIKDLNIELKNVAKEEMYIFQGSEKLLKTPLEIIQ